MPIPRTMFALCVVTIAIGCTENVAPVIPDVVAPVIRDGLWVQPGKGASPRVAFVRDDRYGFLDAAGRVSFAPRFEWADDFRGGFALCSWKGRGTIIDESGSIVGTVPRPAETYFRADIDRIWYLVRKKWGLCDLKGQTLVQPLYDDVDAFSDTMARVNIGARLEFPGFMDGGQHGYVNRDGEPAIACQFDEVAWSFHDGYARVGHNLINQKGETQFSRKGLRNIFSEGLIAIHPYNDDPTTDYVDSMGEVKFTVEGDGEAFAQGLAVVSHNKRAGFIGPSGRFVIQPRFEEAQAFSNGLAGACVEQDCWGYLDLQGQFVSPSHFNEVRPAEREYAIVHYGGTLQTAEDAPVWWEGGRWLMIDRTGRPLAVIREDKPGHW